MKIRVILPVLKNEVFEEITYRELSTAKRRDVEISVVSIEKGPASIESTYDEEVAAPWILEKVREAEEEGFDAVIINCMGDPALNAAREAVKIPVVGPCQASMAIASTVCDKFSVIAVMKNLIPALWRKAREYGFEAKVASIRSVEIPVLELEERKSEVRARLLTEARKCIDDGASAIILGCTGMVGMAADLQEVLKVPVIDPAIAALKLAECLVDMRIFHSKLAYPEPPIKKRVL